eukprot:CAMPEP_0119133292 /NCGR_PEP_ID=MMETSP1310-20130426/13299_1 /TAXON_ID=464262 /ORGANISM="Genus nov. species nov., Strain RCC2339" /LENGTH=174 /DNA_ID=CAMNT_0007123979 /DNA_START=104 /DNA_END=625 /DNA_ORIENTATION=+
MSFNPYPNPKEEDMHQNATGGGAADTLVFHPETGLLVQLKDAPVGCFKEVSKISTDGFYGAGPVAFNKMDQQKKLQFSKTAPKWCMVTRGLNVSGKCHNSMCKANGQSVWVQCGLGNFTLSELVYDSKCPMCKGEVEDIRMPSFYDCFYSLDGKYKENGQVVKLKETDLEAPSD